MDNRENKNILGIDEVGRGAWAGPLVVGACVLNGAKIEGLTDSKALTKKQREKIFEDIKNSSAIVDLGWVSNEELDNIGLSSALKLATRRAVSGVQKKCSSQNIRIDEIVIDGTVNFLENTSLEKYVSTLKKADLLIKSVSAAAIFAKVSRDRFMSKLEENSSYNKYSFKDNSGYGTKKHREALARYGISDIHRKSFKPIAELTSVKINNNNPTITTKDIGDIAEGKVADLLRNRGHEIISRNWKNKWCEIDIVSKKDNTYYFTEVKYRKNNNYGGGESAISHKKISQMHFAADFFVYSNRIQDFDLKLLAAIVEGEDFTIKDIFDID